MSAQQRQNPVLRVDDRTEHPVPLLKADELDQPAGLVVDSPLQGKRRGGVRVAQHLCGARPLRKAEPHKPQQCQVLAGVGAEKARRHAVLHLAAKPVQPCRDPPRVLLVGKNLPRAEEI